MSKDERDGSTLESTRDIAADGDDIVVLTDVAPPRGRGRPVVVGFALVAIVLIIGTVALVTRLGGSTRVQTAPPVPTLPVSKVHPTPKGLHKAPAVKIAVTTIPVTVPHNTVVTSGSVALPTAPPVVSVPTTVTPRKQYGPSVLTWTAPRTLTLAAGTTKALALTAHNGSDGTVTLPHPLSCTPRLDHTEICTEAVQLIDAGQSASASYTIDARGIAPGHYTLQIEGVLSIAVTVTPAAK